MKIITCLDPNGYKRRYIIRDSDPEDQAAELGIPADPPDLKGLDWSGVEALGVDVDELKRKLHNHLVTFGLITWRDVQRSQNGVTQAIMAVGHDRRLLGLLKRQLIMLYKTG